MQNERQSRILVVDDEAANVEAVKPLLEDEGYDVIVASDGRKAIELAENDHPDLILLDVMMPHLNGFQVCKRLKASEKTRGIPIVFLTGADFTLAQDRGIESGAVAYLPKPIGSQELLAMMKFVLSER